MARRAGCRGSRVVAVGDRLEAAADSRLRWVDVPEALAAVPDADLIEHCRLLGGELVDWRQKRDPKKLRIAMVGAWGIPCGISTYAEALWPELGARVGEWTVFAEDSASMPAASPYEGSVERGHWRRGQSLMQLAAALEAYAPDAVLIQHEYGLFPDARHWLAFMARIAPLRPIVTLHSVYWHADKTICEAACPEIAVHSEAAAAVLREKGISAKLYVLPHGCGPVAPRRLYNLYRTPNRFMQFGFGFRYKNWEASIEAVALLKARLPDVFFTGLFSEGLFSRAEHERYYAELRALTEKLQVQQHVAILRGYASEAVLDSFLGTNSLAVFPYKNDPGHVVYGASGAARRAMQAGIPVVVSGVPHFADLGGVCPQASTGQEVAEAVGELLANPKSYKAAQERQAEFMAANSWSRIAEAWAALL